MGEVSLAQLLAAVGSAVNEARLAIEQHDVGRYWQQYYSETGEDGADGPAGLAPRTQRLFLSAGGVRRQIDVPLLTLTHGAPLALDQVKIRLNVRASVDERTGGVRVAAAPLKTDGAETAETADSAAENIIELVFKKEAPPEGAARIAQEANKFI